jgi:hypothetical protein
LDRRDGTIVGIALDDSGQEVDVEALRRDEEAARAAIEHRAHPALAARLAEVPADELVDVAIWLEETPTEVGPRPAPGSISSRQPVDTLMAEVGDRRVAQVRAITAPIAARLARRGFQSTHDDHAPMLYATLPAHLIEEMRDWEDVDRMYLPESFKPMVASESDAIYAPWVHDRGITGAGVPVAVVEVGGQINTANPLLAGTTQDTVFSCLDAHAAAVAGIIRSTDWLETGIAFGSNLWVGGSCGGGVYADWADDVASGASGSWAGMEYDCSAAPSVNIGSMGLTAGFLTRVVISWDTDPAYSSYGVQPSADLDLVIKDPAGNFVASSASFDNTYEIVEFIPPSSGTYTIWVNKYRCDLSPRWLGYAWFR